MCIYSLSVSKDQTVEARQGDHLVKASHEYHGVFMTGGKIACIKPGTKLSIKLELAASTRSINQPDGTVQRRWNGKLVTATMVTWSSGSDHASDSLKLSDGTVIHLSWLVDGCRATIALPRKRNLAKVLGLDQIRADVPVKKPAPERAA